MFLRVGDKLIQMRVFSERKRYLPVWWGRGLGQPRELLVLLGAPLGVQDITIPGCEALAVNYCTASQKVLPQILGDQLLLRNYCIFLSEQETQSRKNE